MKNIFVKLVNLDIFKIFHYDCFFNYFNFIFRHFCQFSAINVYIKKINI
jgi:hypothetical protein